MPNVLIANFLIGVLTLSVLIDKNIVGKLRVLYRSKDFWGVISLFLFLFTSVFYSSDTDEAWRIIELRLPLLLFPIIYGLSPLKIRQVHLVFKVFVSFVCLIPLIGLATQWGKYIETADSGWFYNDNIVQYVGKQAVYFAIYINFALVGIFYFSYTENLKGKFEQVGSVFAFVCLIVSQYLLASRTSMFTTALLIGGFVTLLIINKINKKEIIILLISLIILVIGLVMLFPKVLKRFDSITQIEYQFDNTNPINHFNGEIKKENWNGFNTRIALWTCAIDEIKKRPLLGSGIGDVQNELVKNYTDKNFIFAKQSNYNCHNQYLDILLSNGIIGLVIFLIFLIYLVIKSVKNKNGLLLGVLIVFVLACFTENVLGRNQGVVFIGFFISLLGLNNFNVNSNYE
jgi:O-antigen ligase